MAATVMRNFFLHAVLIAGLALSMPYFALAANDYGQCSYGEDVYGAGCAASGGSPQVSTTYYTYAATTTNATATTSTATTTPVSTGNGLTAEQKQSILGLLASFGADQATLANVTAALNGQASSGSAAGASVSFTRDLELGMTGEDVRALQQYLNAHGTIVSASGDGSLGQETDYFGTLTYRALVAFQNSHTEEILHPMGLTAGTGFFGPVTRAFVNTFHE